MLDNEETSRFKDAVWYNGAQKEVIIVAGCGGIGSHTVVNLARLKPLSMFIYDDDKVELANLAGQLYGLKEVNQYKVNALADKCNDLANYYQIFAITEKYTEECEASKIMICGFDNMNARRIFFNNWLALVNNLPEEEKKDCLFIDGRLSFDELQVFAITGDDTAAITNYKDNYLFSDSEADATICSLKQTSFMAAMIGSIITNVFVNFIANKVNAMSHPFAFLTKYNSQLMLFNTES